jgi:hypothetical protein
VLRGRVCRPDGATRFVYQNLEAEVQQEIRTLFDKLDALSARSPGPQTPDETAEQNQAWAGLRRRHEAGAVAQRRAADRVRARAQKR